MPKYTTIRTGDGLEYKVEADRLAKIQKNNRPKPITMCWASDSSYTCAPSCPLYDSCYPAGSSNKRKVS